MLSLGASLVSSLQCRWLYAFCSLAVEDLLDNSTVRIGKVKWMHWLIGYTRLCGLGAKCAVV